MPISDKPLTNEADGAIIETGQTTGLMTGSATQGGNQSVNVLPNMENMRIPEEKFTQYALDFDKDKDKATAFQNALGYTKSDADVLVADIYANVGKFEAIPKGDIGFGMRYEVNMTLTGPNGKTAKVLTAWIDDKSTGEMRMTNAYVDKPKGGARK